MAQLKHLFILRKAKLNKQGKCALQLRVYINSRRIIISTGAMVTPSAWHQVKQQAKGNSEEAVKINKVKDKFKKRVEDLFDLIEQSKELPPVEAIKNILQGKEQKASITLLETFDRIAEQQKKEKAAKRTIQATRTRKANIAEFLYAVYKVTDIALAKVNMRFMAELESYLRNEKGYAHNYIGKNVFAVERCIKYGLLYEYLKTNPIAAYKFKLIHDRDIVYLTEEEIHLIRNHKFAQPRLQMVADVFIFQCYTSLGYAEYARLNQSHLGKGMGGEDFIFIDREKTGTPQPIPLLNEAKAILEKYKTNPEVEASGLLLPVISNTKTNSYLKEIAGIVGIEKELTTHVGRKSAATLFLNLGMPIEVVSRILGHKNISTTQRAYAHLMQKTISKEMQKVQEKLKSATQL